MKKVIVSILSICAILALVAMKPMYKSFPPVGLLEPPPLVEVEGPDVIVYQFKNQSKCPNVNFDLAFTAKQGEKITNIMAIPTFNGDKELRVSNFVELFGDQINPNEVFSLHEGGLNINIAEKVFTSVSPGFKGRVAKQNADGTYSTELCDCFYIDWDQVNKIITIKDCQ